MTPDSALPPTLSVCIATYRRQERLSLLLRDLAAQTLRPDQIVVVDNDAGASARTVVAAFQATTDIKVVYDVQPEKNISLTRNLTISLATGQWLAFVDDDERAPADWLRLLMQTAQQHQADGVLAPVQPLVPADAPAWIRRGRFYDWPRMPTGDRVPPNRLRLGNALLSAHLVKHRDKAFDPAYGVTGGEDGDLLMRLVREGATIVWCDEAIVTEPVEASRLKLSWILKRARRGGQDFARHVLGGKLGATTLSTRVVFYARAVMQLLMAALLAVLTLPFGRHHAVHWLARAFANFGKLSTLWGGRYLEYA